MELWNTPLPEGYSDAALRVRAFLLNVRHRVKALPCERRRMLETRLAEFHTSEKKGGHCGNRNATAARLAASSL
jgi:hypothetical protein